MRVSVPVRKDPFPIHFKKLTLAIEMLLALLASQTTSEPSSNLVLRNTDNSAAASTDTFLASNLSFKADETGQEICVVKLDNDEEVGVMMGWERPIMEETVRFLCPDGGRQGLKVLNVGFGLGIVSDIIDPCFLPCYEFADRFAFPISPDPSF